MQPLYQRLMAFEPVAETRQHRIDLRTSEASIPNWAALEFTTFGVGCHASQGRRLRPIEPACMPIFPSMLPLGQWRRHFISLLDHDDFGLNQSKIIVIDSKGLERDMQISSRNLRKLDCAGKPVPTFPHPALGFVA
ncbi:MAG: hypothetical protein ACLPID_12705 [Beijerinckiaceae bacterium]